MWDTSTWTPIGEPWVLPRTTYVDDGVITVSPDGERLAALSADGRVRVWTVDDRQPLGGPPIRVIATTIGFADRGRRSRRTARWPSPATPAASCWSTRRPATEQPVMRVPDGSRRAVEFSHDGGILAVANSDGRTQLFDVEHAPRAGPAAGRTSSAAINDVTFSADDSQLATAGVGSHRRPVAPRRRPRHRRRRLGPHRRRDRGGLHQRWPVPRQQRRRREGCHPRPRRGQPPARSRSAARCSPPPSIRPTAGSRRRARPAPCSSSTSAPGAPGPVLDLGDVWIYQVAFDPTSGALAAAVDRPDRAWKGRRVRRGVGPGDRSRDRSADPPRSAGSPIGVAWSPDGSELAVVAENNLRAPPRCRAATTPSSASRSRARMRRSSRSAFSPDGERLATGHRCGVVQQWSAATHRPIGPALQGHTGPVGGCRLQPRRHPAGGDDRSGTAEAACGMRRPARRGTGARRRTHAVHLLHVRHRAPPGQRSGLRSRRPLGRHPQLRRHHGRVGTRAVALACDGLPNSSAAT